MKICSKCKNCKFLQEFHNFSKSKDGKKSSCKKCVKKLNQKRYLEKKKYILNANKQYREKTNYNHLHYERNKEKRKQAAKKYYNNNKEKCIKNAIIYNRQYRQKKYKNDIDFKLKKRLRNQINQILRRKKYKKSKINSAVNDLGCSIEFLKQYLESKFYFNSETNEQMSWNNYGFYGWHIDHVIPLSNFDLTDRKQFLKACHYTNLQPMWAKENLKKSNKIL